MRSMAASLGWVGNQWTSLFNVEMREAGFNMFARNPSSGAYGLAQFINGPSEYYQYGGNPNTATAGSGSPRPSAAGPACRRPGAWRTRHT